QKAWNNPVNWSILIVVLLLVVSVYPLMKAYQARQKAVVVPHNKGDV
ncbi:MAG: hypothetical protein HUJ13_04330, partial [Hydrogenovibrio crunogenus]|nr:hypothetical protein [Hydrogenovibrio crunogenus]